MSANYNASAIGVPYVRGTQVIINYPDGVGGTPAATVTQSTAIIMADGSIRNLDAISTIFIPLDFVNNGNTPIPMVDPTSGAALGTNTTLNTIYLQVLAIVRQIQVASNSAGTNYAASAVGVPYVRGVQLVINWPDALGGLPSATISQSNAVLLADGTVRNLDPLPPITTVLDFANSGSVPIPLVNPSTGAALGPTTNLNTIYENVLALVRQAQVGSGQ